MTRAELIAFLRKYKLAVQASTAPDGQPQAAVVGFAVSDALELVFDTVESTRKYLNLRADPRIGRERLAWPGITHVRVRPTWVRYSDFTREPPVIVELGALTERF